MSTLTRNRFPVVDGIKAVTDADADGVFEAVVAVFDVPDRSGWIVRDIIRKGAFERTLREKGLPPLVWSHMWSLPPIGKTLEAREIDRGLLLKGQLYVDGDGISAEYAKSIHRAMLDGGVKEFSFAYDVWESQSSTIDGEDFRELLALELFEAGPTLVGLNPETELLAVKNLVAGGKYDLGAGVKGDELARVLNDLIDDASGDRADVIADLASEAGVSESTIGQILRGEIKCPPLARLSAFASVLGISRSRLVSAAERDGCEYDGDGEMSLELEERKAELLRISADLAAGVPSPAADSGPSGTDPDGNGGA